MGNFGGKLRQETISKKTADFAGSYLADFAKIDQFSVDMTSVGERFVNRNNDLLFQQQFAREISEC